MLAALATTCTAQPFSIDSFGAVAGVDTLAQALANGAAFASALAAANASTVPSQRGVLIPAGKVYSYLPAAYSYSQVSNLVVLLEGKLELYTQNFNTSYPGWPNPWNPIRFDTCTNVSIASATGNGTLDGRGEEWWWYTIFVADHRPNLIEVQSCVGFTLSGITLRNGPQFHTLLMDLVNSSIGDVTVMVDGQAQLPVHAYIHALPQEEQLSVGNVFRLQRLQGLPLIDAEAVAKARRSRLPSASQRASWSWWDASWTIDPPLPLVYALNTDGLDFSGTGISVTNCSVTNFDDSVCVKPLLGDGSESAFNTSCSNDITISDVSVTWGVGVSMGSVPPDVGDNCINGVTVSRVNFTQPLKAVHVKPNPPKADPAAKGHISNVLYQDLTIKDTVWWSVYIAPQQQEQPGGGTNTGCSFLFPLPNTTCPADPQVAVYNIALRNVAIHGALLSPGILLMNASNPLTGNWTFDGVVATNYSSWPVEGGYYCGGVTGIATGGTSPVPPCFKSI